jgi:ADP-heptose:LPS heptosyltransferase
MTGTDDLSLIFLQGLGNSIINFPIYYQLASKFPTQVVVFNNGSAKFYREFGARVIQIDQVSDLLNLRTEKSGKAATLYPNWKRELLGLSCIRAKEKYHFPSGTWLAPAFPGRKLPAISTRHDIENGSELCKALGVEFDRRLDLSAELGLRPTPAKYVVIHPTASTPFKYYPINFWHKLIRYLESQFGTVHIISGRAPAEMQFCEAIKNSKCLHHAGMGFKELAQLLAGSELFIGLDSSMMHLASMFRRRVVALWTFADFRRIYPYTSDANIYIPKEVLSLKRFDYPVEELSWIKRANPEEFIQILEGRRTPDQTRRDLAENTLRLFTY